MDRKKLEDLRAKYPADKPDASHQPEFKRAIETIFAGTDRRPKPYEGVSSLLDAPLRLDAMQQGGLGGLEVALVGVPMDLGVTNRPGARLGPRAVRAVERIGPYHPVPRLPAPSRRPTSATCPSAAATVSTPALRISRPTLPGSRRPESFRWPWAETIPSPSRS